MNAKKNIHLGSSFDDFLVEEGIFEEVQAAAIKKVLAAALEQYMLENKMTKTAMAEKIKTSRAFVDKILDEENTSITLATMCKVSTAIGKKMSIVLENENHGHCMA